MVVRDWILGIGYWGKGKVSNESEGVKLKSPFNVALYLLVQASFIEDCKMEKWQKPSKLNTTRRWE